MVDGPKLGYQTDLVSCFELQSTEMLFGLGLKGECKGDSQLLISDNRLQ